jgi:methionine-gamma-lyase
MDKTQLKKMGFATQAIHGGAQPNTYGALTNPIYQSSTFVFASAEEGGKRFSSEEPGYIYTRLGNPTQTCIEEKIALLEGSEAALATASGMGAISAALWTALQAGDHVLAGDTLYGCTFSLLNHGLTRMGVEVTFVDMTDLEAVKNALRPNTHVVYMETPANPTLKICDIEMISELAHKNADCLVMVDNTFCSPYIQRPLDMGADVVLHSATKYLNGHGDVIAGFVCGSNDFIQQVRMYGLKDMTGTVLSPFDAFLINRGMKTLSLRMEQHCASALKIATFLEKHPAVESVNYPGLPSFPQFFLAKKQMVLPGGMISFVLKGGIEAGIILMNSLHLCALAVSLGDAETLIEHPASMTHSTYSKEELQAAGIDEGLVRLSVGLEDTNDILRDLQQGLDLLTR